jgi:hypothetical protein
MLLAIPGITCQCLDSRWFGAAAAHHDASPTGWISGKSAFENHRTTLTSLGPVVCIKQLIVFVAV